jgi:hypothetical protein
MESAVCFLTHRQANIQTCKFSYACLVEDERVMHTGIVTNGTLKTGGPYFIMSRTMGSSFGAATGPLAHMCL